VHGGGVGDRLKRSIAERRDGTNRDRPKSGAEFCSWEGPPGWDNRADVRRPRLTRNGSSSVTLDFFLSAPVRSAHGFGTFPFSLSRGRAATSPVLSALEASADRKSTRLNSSHGSISYAVFCL